MHFGSVFYEFGGLSDQGGQFCVALGTTEEKMIELMAVWDPQATWALSALQKFAAFFM